MGKNLIWAGQSPQMVEVGAKEGRGKALSKHTFQEIQNDWWIYLLMSAHVSLDERLLSYGIYVVINQEARFTMCFDSLSISEMQLRSWSAEQPSKSLSSSLEAMVVEMVKERRRKQRDIIAVFILISGNSSIFWRLGGCVCDWSKCVGSFKEGGGGSTWWPVSRHKSYLSLAITSSYLYPGNSEKCATLSNVQIRWGPKFSGLSWHRCKVEGVSTLHGHGLVSTAWGYIGMWALCIGKVV